MKDRLEQLKAKSDQTPDDVEIPVEKKEFMDEFFAQIEEIRTSIDKIDENIGEIKRLYSVILSAPTSDQKTQDELEAVTNEIKKLANNARNKLKSIEQILASNTEERVSADIRIKKSQHAILAKRFVEVMTKYNEAQVEFRDKSKGRIQRQLEITGKTTTDEELEEMLDGGNAAVFTAGALSEIEARHKDIMRLESSIKELHDMFVDIAMLVENQGSIIERIESNMDQSVGFVERAVADTKKAAKFQQEARRTTNEENDDHGVLHNSCGHLWFSVVQLADINVKVKKLSTFPSHVFIKNQEKHLSADEPKTFPLLTTCFPVLVHLISPLFIFIIFIYI
ncbi:hypothetical protein cypCar_00032416 [Cyprinus carpio]|nr:hypothetical protein cypCar_00032416 [Cyprinus carpio]